MTSSIEAKFPIGSEVVVREWHSRPQLRATVRYAGGDAIGVSMSDGRGFVARADDCIPAAIYDATHPPPRPSLADEDRARRESDPVRSRTDEALRLSLGTLFPDVAARIRREWLEAAEETTAPVEDGVPAVVDTAVEIDPSLRRGVDPDPCLCGALRQIDCAFCWQCWFARFPGDRKHVRIERMRVRRDGGRWVEHTKPASTPSPAKTGGADDVACLGAWRMRPGDTIVTTSGHRVTFERVSGPFAVGPLADGDAATREEWWVSEDRISSIQHRTTIRAIAVVD